MQTEDRSRILLLREESREVDLVSIAILGFDIDCVVRERIEMRLDVSPVVRVLLSEL